MLQPLNHLGSPTLDCILGCLFAFTGQPMSGHSPSGMSQQCWVEQNDLDPDLLTTYFPNVAQDAFGLPCCKGTLLAYGLAWSPWGPPGVFLQSLFPADHPSSCSVSWGYFSLGAGLCISLCWTSSNSCWFMAELFKVPLRATSWSVSCSSQSVSSGNLLRAHCIPSARALMN